MKYYFYCGECKYKKHYINLGEKTRGTSHWVNSDIPSIYTNNDHVIVEVTFPDYGIYIYDNDIFENIKKFVDQSDRKFRKRFEWAGEYTGRLLKLIEGVSA